MINELEPSDFSKVAPLFRGRKEYQPVFSIIDGEFPGRIFADQKDNPQVGLVWAISRWGYIDGDPSVSSFNESLPALVRDVIVPCSLQMKMNWFELYTSDSPEWAAIIEKSLGEYKPSKHYETVFTFDRQRYLASKRPFVLSEGEWIGRKEFPILPPAAREASFVEEKFREKTSFGFALVRDGKNISVCRSNGFVSGREFMIDVYTTDKNERSKGHATAVGTALIDFCLENGYIPLWETTQDNIASQKLASRLGFVESESYPVYAIEF
jgi:RimJ/RimL family protein N-acetyltransferase